MNDVATTVPNLFSSSAYTYDPYTYPDNLTQASSALNDASAYAPVSVSIDINEGETLRLGLRKQAIVSADWVAYDHFQLRYEGSTTEVEDISSDPSGSVCVYDLQGRLLQKGSNSTNMSKGVYIIKGEKVLVK
ncbi:MAG: T9SS type A sorting domain-containing protein [Paludibacteraceae bacterium]|nr:T9SS type A sorting domain-containing protein [Paludibacteraceae bacterium]